MEKFKVGDTVKILSSDHDSINVPGDVGVIKDVDSGSYKVFVVGRFYMGEANIANWHEEEELELVKSIDNKLTNLFSLN